MNVLVKLPSKVTEACALSPRRTDIGPGAHGHEVASHLVYEIPAARQADAAPIDKVAALLTLSALVLIALPIF